MSWHANRSMRPKICGKRLLCSGLAGLGLLVVLVTVTPLVSWWAGVLAGPWEDPNGDDLIVLGGSLLGDGVMGQSSYWRSTYAVLAWGEGTFHRVVVSGGGPAGNSIAEPMRDFLECRGVHRAAIQIETRARSTHENALYVAELLAGVPGRKVLLTSDYHMFRAHRAFKNAGLLLQFGDPLDPRHSTPRRALSHSSRNTGAD